jgi:hypothetical protein
MMFDVEMFGVLLEISIGTWLLVNRVFLKSGVKVLVEDVHRRYLQQRGFSLDKVQKWAVSLAVLVVACGLTLLAHSTSLYIAIENVTELQYAGGLEEATFVKCFLGVEPIQYTALWYFDLVGTIAFVVTGSKIIHRLEKYVGYQYDAKKRAAQ